MRILALDTATEACSVALLTSPGATLAQASVIGRYEELGKSHAQQVLSMVEALLAGSRPDGCCQLSMPSPPASVPAPSRA